MATGVINAFVDMLKQVIYAVSHPGQFIGDWQHAFGDFWKGVIEGSAPPVAPGVSGPPMLRGIAFVNGSNGDVTITTGNLTFGPGTPKQHAAQLLKHVAAGARAASRTNGDLPSNSPTWNAIESGTYQTQ